MCYLCINISALKDLIGLMCRALCLVLASLNFLNITPMCNIFMNISKFDIVHTLIRYLLSLV